MILAHFPSAILASILAIASAQSPPNFEPATSNPLSLTFDGVHVNSGMRLALNIPQRMPSVGLPSSSSASSNSTYLLLMVDPDAPSPLAPGPVAQILHWLAPSLTRTSYNGTLSSSTAAIAPYRPPMPPSIEPHRYTLLLFVQTEQPFTLPQGFEQYNAMNRTSFDAKKFADAAGLGKPIASTYFLTGNDTGTSVANETSRNGTSSVPVAASMAGSKLNVFGWSVVVGIIGVTVGVAI